MILGVCLVASLHGQEPADDASKDPTNEARLKFMRNVMSKIKIKPTEEGDQRDLAIKMQPLLRYNDPSRGVADSAIWRLGGKGRPAAIVTSEIYRLGENQFAINHEYVALDNPRFTMESSGFQWKPPTGSLKFQALKSEEKPSNVPSLRLTQIKRLATRFTTTQFFDNNKIVLRLLPTPIDRYAPSDKPRADGAIFAFVWGVNPEALLFIESNGDDWSFALARTGSALIWSELDDVEVWRQSRSTEDHLPTALYAISSRRANISPTFETPSEEESPKR